MGEGYHEFDDDDAILCLDNALRLLEDAFGKDISKATKAALVELSMEESAKAFLLCTKLKSPHLFKVLGLDNPDKEIEKSFKSHDVKISLMRTYWKSLSGDWSKSDHLESNLKNMEDDEFESEFAGILFSQLNRITLNQFKSMKEIGFYVNYYGEKGLAEPISLADDATLMALAIVLWVSIQDLYKEMRVDKEDVLTRVWGKIDYWCDLVRSTKFYTEHDTS